MDYEFDKPVSVIIGTAIYVVSGTREAAELLASKWPSMVGGFCRDAAKQALLQCMGRKRNPRLIRKAREAFIAAAAEADMLTYDRSH